MTKLDQELTHAILQEIDAKLSHGILPVHNGHLNQLSEEGKVIDYLVLMKRAGLISGDLVTKASDGTPFRMTNIRLTYVGIRALRS